MKEDLVGQKIGHLSVLKKTQNKRHGYWLYLCLCDCGTSEPFEVPSTNLNRKTTTSCGCVRRQKMIESAKARSKDVTGQLFGTYMAIRPTEDRKSKSVVWEFKCQECGRLYHNSLAHMNEKDRPTCECQKHNSIDLSGKEYGNLTVLRKSTRKSGGSTTWECKCKCGNEKIVYATKYSLEHGKVVSCGCYHRAATTENLEGQEFNYLKAIKQTKDRSNGSILWECECLLCGKRIKASSANLKNGGVKSCGCHTQTDSFKANMNPMGINMRKLKKKDTETQKNNTSDFTGVSYDKKSKKWHAYLDICGVRKGKYLPTKEEAIKVRKKLKEKADEIIQLYDSLPQDEKEKVALEHYNGEMTKNAWLREELNSMLKKTKL